MQYKRVFIEKKEDFNVEGQLLLKEFKDYLGVDNLTKVRVVNVYDLINISEKDFHNAVDKILSEQAIDHVYENNLPVDEKEKLFRVEYLPGQYNQREDSLRELLTVLTNNEEIKVKNSKIIILENIEERDLETIKSYYINPIEMREISFESFTYEEEDGERNKIEIIEGFISMTKEELKLFKSKYGIGMDMEDVLFCQDYFKEEERRDPTITELKVIDTYWSDHCRHTTFMTEIVNVDIEESKYKEIIEETFKEYLNSRNYVYGEKEKPLCLMDLATINMKEIKKKGLLEDKEESEEVNAASIEIDVDIDGKAEKWLLMFKNETHNHPTEMEPFGGASTCLGGGIRDPLSGRSYVYQAMRITGAADPRQKYEETLAGKLPQRKITQRAMEGYSSYGNQIGAPAGLVKEIYHEGYVAKRMEVGALVAAAPKSWVVRGKSEPGDLVILVGGRTGRDGLGGAVGSSKEHTEDSLNTSGAEVQKGNPPLERKIVRLFRKEEVSKMIKKCNDFGAGGVSVAIGELADGLNINLDKVPLKYSGLDGTEIALSESQERMAVVIDKENLDRFLKYVEEEDLEGTVVATVSSEKRLHMTWKDDTIVNISRAFLDTNGIRKKTKVSVGKPEKEEYLNQNPSYIKGKNIKEDWIKNMSQLNISSQKGLIEKFDHTVGSGTVLMPLGGKHKLTPAEGMAAKIPVLHGETKTCSLMTYGFDPELSKWSPFHGGYYAVIESIAKSVAMGGDYRKLRLTFQEYFERLGEDEIKWGKPFSALLGAYLVEKELDIPSIGGKDSMSGTFEEIHVPPTLISFAVGVDKVDNIISPEFKAIDNEIVLIPLNINEQGMVDLNQLKINYERVKELIDKKIILSASTVKFGGIGRSISEMAFGNKIGFKFMEDINKDKLFTPMYGSLIVELQNGVKAEEVLESIEYKILGKTIKDEFIQIDKDFIDLNQLISEWESPLQDIFPEKEDIKENIENIEYTTGNKIYKGIKVAKPKVFIPIFTGTHGEYDMERAFKEAGGEVETFVFKTLSLKNIEDSFKEMAKKIRECQIIGLPNGAVLGDEPETGGKLIKVIFNNPYIKEAVNNHLYEKDGLILGIGNGFQGLIKSGLIESGQITDLKEDSVYVAYNKLGQHISTLVNIKVTSNLSPWFNEMNVGEIYTAPLSTKEGRIIGDSNKIKSLVSKGQVSSQYVDLEGRPTYNGSFNPTGSNLAIESMTSPDGRVLGTCASIDRLGKSLYKNGKIQGSHKIFESGIKYFD